MSTHHVLGGGPPIFDGLPVVQDAPPRPNLTVEGVPASVTREQIAASIRALGVDPSEVCGLSFDETAVHVEVYSNGRPASVPAWRWLRNGESVATHRLTIPILDKEPT